MAASTEEHVNERVGVELGLSATVVEWLSQAGQHAAAPTLVLPDDLEAAEQLRRLGVDAIDRDEALQSRPDQERDPSLWWVLEQTFRALLADMGRPVPIGGHAGWPVAFGAGASAAARWLPVWMYLAVLPHALRYHADRGISDEISWRSLSTPLGDVLAKHRSVTGLGGIGLFGFGTSAQLYFRGVQYRLGQLEFNRGEISLSDGPCGYGLSVHIPPIRPLTPVVCDDSFAQASAFFPRHFAEEPPAFFSCRSWLLDPQLADYLPATSNIVQFQRRFHLLPATNADLQPSDGDVAEYLFGRALDDLADVPRTTRLQQAFTSHLAAGGHWHDRTGWLTFT